MLPALFDHLWQSTLFAGVAGLLTLALRNNPARVRYGLWLTASCKFLIPLSMLIALGSHIEWRRAPRSEAALPVVIEEVSQPFTGPVSSPSLPAVPPSVSPLPTILFGIWAAGFIGIAGSWWIRWQRIRATVRAASPVLLEIPIPALSSPTQLEPGIFGILRPVLLLPEGITERLTPAQFKAVIAHELCHVRHRDNLIAAMHMFVETVFWFHPLIWWIGKRMVEERERACDEEVLRTFAEPKAYAEGILNICKLYVESSLKCVSGVTGGSNLKKRIEAIMKNRSVQRLNRSKTLLLIVAGMLAVTGPIAVGVLNAPFVRAQSPRSELGIATEKFEVASIKRNVSGDPGRFIRPSGGRLSISNMTLKNLITIAYEVRPFQLSGGPSWIDSESYNIEAKPEGNATPKQMEGAMLQALLEDRFKLQIRHDTKELPVYVLTVGRNGSKLQRSEEKDCVPFDPGNPPLPSAPGRNPSDMCGFLGLGRGSLNAKQASMAALAMALSQLLGRTVVDKTGLAGEFDAHMTFDPNDIANPTASSTDPALPSIFTAVQEQLGLKLESAKGPVDILVIDRAERPTEN